MAIALASGVAICASQASASAIVDGKCVSVTASSGCLFSGNINNNPDPSNTNGFIYAQNVYNQYNNTHPSAQPDITLNFLADIAGNGTSTSGSWSLPGYDVNFIAVKAADYFVLYQIDPASSGTWNTFDIPYKNNPHGISHYILFGDPTSGVPEASTWAMMILGVGAIGAALRRKRQQASVNYSFA